jgi:hypothetical protein
MITKKFKDYQDLYQFFSKPLTDIDCGLKCGPYNDYGVPVCCDINLVIPSAFEEEWDYLQKNTNLWQPWKNSSSLEGKKLVKQLQDGQIALQCLGYNHCQRQFRTITCRAFPFFPYLDRDGSFMGLSYYRDYRDQCWIISNLSRVSREFKTEFQSSYQRIFQIYPEMKNNFQLYSQYARDNAAAKNEELTFLDFADGVFQVKSETNQPVEISFDSLESFGPFKVMKDLVFPDEIQSAEPD